jgi:hypothetical protein
MEEHINNYKMRSLKSIEKMTIVMSSIFRLILGFSILTFCIKLTFGVGTTYVMLLMEHVTMGIALKLFEGTILICIMVFIASEILRAIAHFGRRLFLALRDKYVFVLDTDTNDTCIMLEDEFDELIRQGRMLNNLFGSIQGGQNEDS